MTAGTIRVLDTVTRTAPLGVRFWDPATRRRIGNGLVVTARPHAMPERAVTLVRNASGAHVLAKGPGLSRSAWGDGTDAFWAAPPEHAAYALEVRDRAGRFLPIRFEAALPHRDFFVPACMPSPPPSPAEPAAVQDQAPAGFVPLFSAPGRAASGNEAVIRAALRHGDDRTPAAWAVLVAQALGRVAGVGVADARGDLTMLFPFPELDRRPSAAGSPIESPPAPRQSGLLPVLAAEVTLRVFYGGAADLAGSDPPDFCALFDQPERLLAESLSPFEALGSVRLVLGRELWLQSAGSRYLHVA